MIAPTKTLGSPSGKPSTTRPYASIKCAKNSGHYRFIETTPVRREFNRAWTFKDPWVTET